MSKNEQTTKRTYQVGASTLSLEFGDITGSKADVLVSSDDSYLTMGGGVSAAIRRAAGQAYSWRSRRRYRRSSVTSS